MSWLKHKFQARYAIMVIMVSYNPRFNFVYKLQVFQDFWGEKNVHRVLVLNFVEISKDFLIFIFLLLKNPWNKVWVRARRLHFE